MGITSSSSNPSSSSTKLPNTNKKCRDSSSDLLRYGVCEMQGWRPYMEDATLSLIDNDISIFGVFDGHGGYQVSKFVSNYFYKVLTNISYYKTKQYERALIEAFLKFDELIKLDNVNNLLKNYDSDESDEEEFEFLNFTSKKQHINYQKTKKNVYKENGSIFNNKIYSPGYSTSSSFKDLNYSTSEPSKKSIDTNDYLEDFVKKRENIKSNNQYHRNNVYLSDSKINHDSFYSFGGVLIEESNQIINQRLLSLYTGTTANVVLIKNEYFYVSNAGDCLSVLYKNGKAIRLNTEHKVTNFQEKNRIINSGTKIINDRIDGKLNLSRAIGDLMFKNNKNLKRHEQSVIANPDISKFKITPDMEFIIMGCDGVWDCVDVQLVCDYISSRLKEKTEISKIIADLFDVLVPKTNKNHIGTDNMSCIIIELKK